MACVRYKPRPGSKRPVVADYRDAGGRRHQVRCASKAEAWALIGREARKRRGRIAGVGADVTVEAYSERWLQLCAGLKPATLEQYRSRLRSQIVPALGAVEVRALDRAAIRGFLASVAAAGKAPSTVRVVHAVLAAMLSSAVDDGLIESSPASGVIRGLHLAKASRPDAKAMTPADLERFLEAVKPEFHDLFFVMSRTGLRLGEALALRWEDVDLDISELRVRRTVSASGVGSPKGGRGRIVDLGPRARDVLEARRELRTTLGRYGWGGEPLEGAVAVFSALGRAGGGPPSQRTAQRAFRAALRASGISGRYTPHCLRHTFASVLLAAGVSPAYVQEQLGHARIELTVGLYGRWLRKRAPGAQDHLEVARGGEDEDADRSLHEGRSPDPDRGCRGDGRRSPEHHAGRHEEGSPPRGAAAATARERHPRVRAGDGWPPRGGVRGRLNPLKTVVPSRGMVTSPQTAGAPQCRGRCRRPVDSGDPRLVPSLSRRRRSPCRIRGTTRYRGPDSRHFRSGNGKPEDPPSERGDEDEHYEERTYFVGCTCDHERERHGWGECLVEGCPCEGGWEE
jgi:integrase